MRHGRFAPSKMPRVLARPLFIYVAEKSLARPEAQQFVEFYIANAGGLAHEVGYVELGREDYPLVAAHFKARRLGTIFGEGGSRVGVTIEQLLAKER